MSYAIALKLLLMLNGPPECLDFDESEKKIYFIGTYPRSTNKHLKKKDPIPRGNMDDIFTI